MVAPNSNGVCLVHVTNPPASKLSLTYNILEDSRPWSSRARRAYDHTAQSCRLDIAGQSTKVIS